MPSAVLLAGDSRLPDRYNEIECKMGLNPIYQMRKDTTMLWTICAILVILWLLGVLGGIGGGMIHVLLVIAVVVIAFNFLSGRRSAI